MALVLVAVAGLVPLRRHSPAPTQLAAQQAPTRADAGTRDAGATSAPSALVSRGSSAQADASVSTVSGTASVSPAAAVIPCQSDLDCRRGPSLPRGRCFTAAIAAQYSQSFARCEPTGTWLRAHPVNTCVFDECTESESPAGDSCPAGQRCGTLDMAHLPYRVCVPSGCSTDVQCRREVGGRCASYLATGRCAQGGWACSYPSDPCVPRSPSRMCPQRTGEVAACRPEGPRGRFVCAVEPVVLPVESAPR